MKPLGNPREHFWLTLGMAKATGADLSVALHDKRITRTQYSEIVNKCRRCKHAEACAATLAACQGSLDAVPAYCVNHDVLEALAA